MTGHVHCNKRVTHIESAYCRVDILREFGFFNPRSPSDSSLADSEAHIEDFLMLALVQSCHPGHEGLS